MDRFEVINRYKAVLDIESKDTDRSIEMSENKANCIDDVCGLAWKPVNNTDISEDKE